MQVHIVCITHSGYFSLLPATVKTCWSVWGVFPFVVVALVFTSALERDSWERRSWSAFSISSRYARMLLSLPSERDAELDKGALAASSFCILAAERYALSEEVWVPVETRGAGISSSSFKVSRISLYVLLCFFCSLPSGWRGELSFDSGGGGDFNLMLPA